MTERFKIVHLNSERFNICSIQDTAQKIPTFYNDLGYEESVEPICDLLNELNDENVFLTKQIDYWKAKFNEDSETFTMKDIIDLLNKDLNKSPKDNKKSLEILYIQKI